MRMTLAAVIIAIGFTVLYLTITGKIDIFAAAFRQAFLPGSTAAGKPGTAKPGYNGPMVPGTKIPQPYKMPKFTLPKMPSF